MHLSWNCWAVSPCESLVFYTAEVPELLALRLFSVPDPQGTHALPRHSPPAQEEGSMVSVRP